MDRFNRFRYDQLLVSGYLAAVEGLIERLDAGIAVADIGCGSGHCLNIMAAAFPKSSFVGFDIAEDAIADGEAEAAQLGLSNARFEVRASPPCRPRASTSSPRSTPSTTRPHLTSYCAGLVRRSPLTACSSPST